MELDLKKIFKEDVLAECNNTYVNKVSVDSVEFDICGQKFILTCNEGTRKYYTLISSNNSSYEWIDAFNTYLITKLPKTNKILAKLYKVLKEESLNKSLNNSNKDSSIEESLDYYLHIEKTKLEKMFLTSKSPIEINAKVRQIFDIQVIKDMIINEYLEIFKKGYNISVINSNIYHWRISLSKFNSSITDALQKLNSIYNYNCIVVDILFNDKYYPNYPPVVKIIRPRLNNSLMYRISNSRSFQLEYWNPSFSMTHVINRIETIINEYGSIDINSQLNDSIKYPNGSYIDIETKLLKLASYIDINNTDEIDKSEKLTRQFNHNTQNLNINQNKNITQKSNKAGWQQGTGYGHSGASKWNPQEYVNLQKEKDANIIKLITSITHEIEDVKKYNRIAMFNSIANSLLVKFLKEQLDSSTLLDMLKRKELYMLYLNLLQNFATDDAVYILDVQIDGSNLFNILKKLNEQSIIALKLDQTNEFAISITLIFELIEPVYKEYIKSNSQKITITPQPSQPSQQNDLATIYKEKLEKLKFDTMPILYSNYYPEYSKLINSSKLFNTSLKWLSSEISTLSSSLEIHLDSSIFLRVDESNSCVMRILITGPQKTPYSDGCFIFDVYIPQNYPKNCPGVTFRNTGGKRFNPNLYESGKVCLSILGTYSGPSPDVSEQWNPSTSTLLQVFTSIQAQILIETPYFNEPGYENSMKTDLGKSQSNKYNQNVRLYTMEHAILDLLKKPSSYQQFEEVIKMHFKLKKKSIIDVIDNWTKESIPSNLSKYKKLSDEIKFELSKL